MISIGITDWAKQLLYGVGLVAVLGLYPLGYHFGGISEKDNQRAQYTESLEGMVKGYNETQTMLSTIAQGQQVVLSEIRNKQDNVREGVKDYGKTVDGSNHCLDPKWVSIYNSSIPRYNKSESGSKIDGTAKKIKSLAEQSK